MSNNEYFLRTKKILDFCKGMSNCSACPLCSLTVCSKPKYTLTDTDVMTAEKAIDSFRADMYLIEKHLQVDAEQPAMIEI